MASAAHAAPLSLDDFLAWEEAQPERWERVGGIVRMMAGGTATHDGVGNNLRAALIARLRGSGCFVQGPDLKVVSPSGTVAYPDAFIRCGSRRGSATTIEDPVVIFEVLSPSTAQHDLTLKREAYQAIPSLRRIVYLATHWARLDMAVRDPDGRWHDEVTGRLDGVLDLPELEISLPLAEIYAETEAEQAAGDPLGPVIERRGSEDD